MGPDRPGPGELALALVDVHDTATLEALEDLEVLHLGREAQNLWNLRPLAAHGLVIAARLIGEVVGCAVLVRSFAKEPTAYLLSLVVAKKHRNRGIGGALLAHALALAATRGCERVQATLDPAVPPAHRLRARHGFRLIGALPRWFGEGEDRQLVECDMSAAKRGGE